MPLTPPPGYRLSSPPLYPNFALPTKDLTTTCLTCPPRRLLSTTSTTSPFHLTLTPYLRCKRWPTPLSRRRLSRMRKSIDPSAPVNFSATNRIGRLHALKRFVHCLLGLVAPIAPLNSSRPSIQPFHACRTMANSQSHQWHHGAEGQHRHHCPRCIR